MRYDIVIFDLDGTLLYTLEDIRDSLNRTLSLYKLREQSLEEVRAHVGNGSARLVELSLPAGRGDPRFGRILDDYSDWYRAHCRIKTRPYPGIMDLLKTFCDGGVSCAIVSNKPDAAVQELNRAFFGAYMSAAVGERPGIRRKPAPDTVLEAMKELHAIPDRTVYVGDSEVDIATAAAAGIRCISVSWGFRTKRQLLQSGAETIVKDAGELLDLIK